MNVRNIVSQIKKEVPELAPLINTELELWKSDNLPINQFHADFLERVLLDYLRDLDFDRNRAAVERVFACLDRLLKDSNSNVGNAISVYFGEALLSNRKLYSKVQPYFGPLLKQDMERMKSALGLKW